MSANHSRTRNSNPEAVPRPGDPDRKRVLNVLAQRRYRKRRRDKMAALEAEAQKKNKPSSSTTSLPSPPSSDAASLSLEYSDFDEMIISNSDPQIQDLTLSSSNFCLSTELSSAVGGFTDPISSLLDLNSGLDNSIDLNTCINPEVFQTHGFDLSSSNFTNSPKSNLGGDMIMDIPSLKVMKVTMDIARMLGCEMTLFDPAYTHVLKPITHIKVPNCLQPTPAQQMIPHHPLLDLLPWPSVRTKLICAFSQAIPHRPPGARDPLALMALMSDLDDSSEGLRISGSEELDEDYWEVGQQIFNNWWWAFEPALVKQSNRLREKRGAARLSLPGSHSGNG